MNGGDVLSMARQAGFVVKHDDPLLPMLKAFAYLVAKRVLDEAAQAAGPEDSYRDDWFAAKADSVKRIRALSKT